MYISNSSVQMKSQRTYSENYYRRSASANWNILTGNCETTVNTEGNTFGDLKNRLSETSQIARVSPQENYASSLKSMRQQMIDYLLYLLFGKKTSLGNTVNNLNSTGMEADGGFSLVNNGVGGVTENYFYYSESEQVTLDMNAVVNTTDGRSIQVNFSAEFSREFVLETSSVINYGQPLVCDPLVINLDCDLANVTSQKFFFDLDCDGSEESISMATGGSGFLTLDKNGDGIINDGSELFGTTSGNGFEDLRAYDTDGNGWIDEADEIFDKLKIWTKSETGTNELIALGKAGIGAIYLGSKDSQFSLTNADNSVNAYVRKTGLFLYENGMAGTIQQLDLATETTSDQKA